MRPLVIEDKIGPMEGITHLDLPDAFWIEAMECIHRKECGKEKLWNKMVGGVLRKNVDTCLGPDQVDMLFDAITTKLQHSYRMPAGWSILPEDPIQSTDKPHILITNSKTHGKCHIDGCSPNALISIVVNFVDTWMTYWGPLLVPTVFDRLSQAEDGDDLETVVQEVAHLLEEEERTSTERKNDTPKVPAGTCV